MVLLSVYKMEAIFLKLNSFDHMNSKRCLNIRMKTSFNLLFPKLILVIHLKASKVKT